MLFRSDNKFAALNSAVWSGGSFIYIPPGVKVDMPLQAYFRINAENIGQFERTLIIADEGSEVHYIEGCTAPVYSSESLHSAVVELVAHKDAKLRYTTIQNWSNDVYSPCKAFVVDLMCHSISGKSKALAICSASMVLPVPGSPFIRRGFCN